MEFKTFQSNCKYAQYGLKDDSASEFELTCRKPECVPSGQSWGKCSEFCCPCFGLKITGGEMRDEKTGKVIMTFSDGKLVCN